MKISVITASYNYAQYIEEAINSVINQSYQDWELIVIDDASSDNSVEIIKSYCQKDSRIKLFQNEQNKGLSATLLQGLSHATGDWVAFLESDDFFAPDNLSEKVEIIEDAKRQGRKEAKLIFNKVEFLCEEKRPQQEVYEKTQIELSKKKFPRNMLYDFNVDNQILTFSCVMVESNIIKNADFNAPLDAALDRWLWIHLAQNNDFYYLDKALTTWRLHKNSYIQECKKPILNFPQIAAYFDIYKKENKPFRIGLFLLYSVVLSACIKVFRKLR